MVNKASDIIANFTLNLKEKIPSVKDRKIVNQRFKHHTCSPILCLVCFTVIQAGTMFLCVILERLSSQEIFLAMISPLFLEMKTN